MTARLAPAVEAVILRAIAKDPADRFADAVTFRRELGRAWSGARGSRRSAAQRIAVAAPYARRGPNHGCRIRSIAPSPARVAYGAPRRGASESVDPHDLPTRTADDAITVVWSDAFAAWSPAPANRSYRASISRRGVFCSAAAFFAVAGGLAMWFVR
jgi:hypothetical protein